jgi:hypothetical protein
MRDHSLATSSKKQTKNGQKQKNGKKIKKKGHDDIGISVFHQTLPAPFLTMRRNGILCILKNLIKQYCQSDWLLAWYNCHLDKFF